MILYIYTHTHTRTLQSQKFCNILVHSSLQCIYLEAEAVQAIEDTYYGW